PAPGIGRFSGLGTAAGPVCRQHYLVQRRRPGGGIDRPAARCLPGPATRRRTRLPAAENGGDSGRRSAAGGAACSCSKEVARGATHLGSRGVLVTTGQCAPMLLWSGARCKRQVVAGSRPFLVSRLRRSTLHHAFPPAAVGCQAAIEPPPGPAFQG